MAKQAVNTGVLPNDGQGDNLRSGAVKINNNFSELYTALGDGTNLTNVTNGVFNSAPALSTGSNKITFKYAAFSDLPSATTYDGMLAKVTADSAVYYAHNNAWVKLLDVNKNIGDLSNVSNTAPTNGDSLVWDQSLGSWKPDAVSGGGGGSSSFAGLSDTPASFSTHGGKLLRVNSGATAVEFATAITASEVANISIDALSDVDTTTSAPSTGQVLKWDGAKWAPAADVTSGGGGTDADTLDGQDGSYYLNYKNCTNTPTLFGGAFLNLSDTPGAFTGAANRFVKVKADGTGLEFVADQSTDQNLFATVAGDSGSTTANTLTDTLTIAGGANIATSVTGDTLTVAFNGTLGATTLGALTDVNTAGAAAGNHVGYNGSSWEVVNGVRITWTLGANQSSDYTFTGPGFPTTTNDPVLYLMRGFTYVFINTTGGSHPFEIRTTNGGSAYTDGVTGSKTGTQYFTVPMGAPNTLYYQCTAHTNMGNTINIVT